MELMLYVSFVVDRQNEINMQTDEGRN